MKDFLVNADISIDNILIDTKRGICTTEYNTSSHSAHIWKKYR